ncbi:hypothetical protein Tco_0979481 [Tanacetum coccineum]
MGGGGAPAQTRSERVLEKSNEPPLLEGHTSRSGEGMMENQFELTANVPITPHDSPLPGDYTPRSDDGRPKLHELMTISHSVYGWYIYGEYYASREIVPTDQGIIGEDAELAVRS